MLDKVGSEGVGSFTFFVSQGTRRLRDVGVFSHIIVAAFVCCIFCMFCLGVLHQSVPSGTAAFIYIQRLMLYKMVFG